MNKVIYTILRGWPWVLIGPRLPLSLSLFLFLFSCTLRYLARSLTRARTQTRIRTFFLSLSFSLIVSSCFLRSTLPDLLLYPPSKDSNIPFSRRRRDYFLLPGRRLSKEAQDCCPEKGHAPLKTNNDHLPVDIWIQGLIIRGFM